MWARVVGNGHRILSSQQGGVLSGVPPLEESLSLFFVQATIILGITRFLSLLGSYIRQPRVIFEIIGGVLLGPSAIGRHQQFLTEIFPSSSLGYLDIVANIGLTLYLFLVGLELDPALLKSHARKAGGIALIGMAVPFALGIGISKIMQRVLQGDDPDFKDVSFTSFFVFIGTAMSITAFPVLARLLKEGGLIYTPAGAMAMGAAALNDAVAWCLLTLAISIANAGNMGTAGYIFLTVIGFALTLFVVVKPIFERIVSYIEGLHRADMQSNLFVFTLCLLFMCAWTTALLGVHAIFGAFLFGLIVPRGSHLFKECNERIEEFVVSFTLPLYFALSGLKTDVTTISSGEEGGITVLVCVCATIGKFIGAGGAALLGGMSFRESAVIAVLMNTRGLVELIVLNLGMQSGILNTRTFSVMVIMCLFTTFITSPIVEFIFPAEMRKHAMDNDSLAEKDASETSPSLDTTETALCLPEKITAENFSRVAVAVDDAARIQPLVNTVSFLAPQRIGAELCVTALHFIEPTRSARDEFLALNSRGKLIRIDEESTDIFQALQHNDDPSAKPAELLPLSVFCKAMQMPVNAFRIQGDPDEFPQELKILSRQNDCEIVFLPWKAASHYLEKFFWHSVHCLDQPVVLVMQKEAVALSSDISDDGSVRLRSNTHNNSETNSRAEVSIKEEGSSASKQRGNSIFQHEPYQLVDQAEHHSQPHAEPLYTNVPLETLPPMRRATIKTNITKLVMGQRAGNVVVAVLLGELADLVLLSLLLKIGQNKQNDIHVMLPKDHDIYPLSNIEAYAQFTKAAADDHVNIDVHALESISTDYEGIYEECNELPYDLILFSFVEPRESQGSDRRSEGGLSPSARGRSHTFSAIDSIIHPVAADPLDMRIQTGMPTRCVYSSLSNPELGHLGSLIQEGRHTKNSIVWIFHEPEKVKMHHLHQQQEGSHSDRMAAPSLRGIFGGTISTPESSMKKCDDDEVTVELVAFPPNSSKEGEEFV